VLHDQWSGKLPDPILRERGGQFPLSQVTGISVDLEGPGYPPCSENTDNDGRRNREKQSDQEALA